MTSPDSSQRDSIEGTSRRALLRGLGAAPVTASMIASPSVIALYQMEGLRLQSPRRLPALDRAGRGFAEFQRWHKRGRDFLAGAAFYRNQSNAPMAALLLHQACEHLYLCALWSVTLYGPRTHALDELREAAEALDIRLRDAWPRETPFERRAFACIRRAYIEARYGDTYRISLEELAWAFERVEELEKSVIQVCADHHTSLIVEPVVPMLPSVAALAAVAVPQLHIQAKALQGASRVVSRARPSGPRWRRLIPVNSIRLRRSYRSSIWSRRIAIALVSVFLFFAGSDGGLLRMIVTHHAPTDRYEPAIPSAVLDFDVNADTVLGAVSAIAKKAGYRIKATDDILAIRWAGGYHAKVSTFDALADILRGSGVCSAIRGDTITIRYCNKTSPPIVVAVQSQTMPDTGEPLRISR